METKPSEWGSESWQDGKPSRDGVVTQLLPWRTQITRCKGCGLSTNTRPCTTTESTDVSRLPFADGVVESIIAGAGAVRLCGPHCADCNAATGICSTCVDDATLLSDISGASNRVPTATTPATLDPRLTVHSLHVRAVTLTLGGRQSRVTFFCVACSFRVT